jgi:hypothetical protein
MSIYDLGESFKNPNHCFKYPSILWVHFEVLINLTKSYPIESGEMWLIQRTNSIIKTTEDPHATNYECKKGGSQCFANLIGKGHSRDNEGE